MTTCLLCHGPLGWEPMVPEAAICASCCAAKLLETRGSQRLAHNSKVNYAALASTKPVRKEKA